ncbi:MAG: hypothetical protein ACE5E4_04860 [Candidatus Binatia bacterium]
MKSDLPSLSALLGHDTPRQRLALITPRGKSSADDRRHHALLFVGPPGVGKFKTALWMAARLKCEQPGSCPGLYEAGGADLAQLCRGCRQLALGNHPDVVLIQPLEEGKSISIAQISPRDRPVIPHKPLTTAMSSKPLRRGPRIGVIREAERLGRDAQQAMLKLLEEPPGFSVIVLVASSPSLLLPTVRSRCLVVRFGLLRSAEIERVVSELGAPPDQASRASAIAAGSVRRALDSTEEAMRRRAEIVKGYEELLEHREVDLEAYVSCLTAQGVNRLSAMRTLLEWQLAKVHASLDQPAEQGSDELDGLLARSSRSKPLAATIADAGRLHAAFIALDHNANAKLAIRDALIRIRD